MAPSIPTAQLVLDHFLPFFFMPPRGSEQIRCSIGPRPFFPLSRHLVAQSRHAARSLLTIFFFNNSPLLFSLTPPRGSEQKQTLAETTRPAPFPRDK